MHPSFWRGKRVFVTGHTGFKGAWLTLWLRHLGADVTGFALAPETRPSLYTAAQVGRAVRSIIGDIREASVLTRAMRAHRPHIVFHLAAQALVVPSYSDPVGTLATNVMGTVNVLEAIRACPSVRVAVVVTSDKCYENRESNRRYRESDPLGGKDPYSASKACAEIVTRAWRDSYFRGREWPAVATARAGNVVGGGDWARYRLLPDLMRAFSRGAVAEVRNPAATRPWQHVLDPLAGYLLLARRLWQAGAAYASAWNFAPGRNDLRHVGWVADATRRHWGGNARWKAVARARGPHEAMRLGIDATKARRELGWHRRLGIDEALNWTVEWYKRYYAHPHEARALTETQIARYERRLADG